MARLQVEVGDPHLKARYGIFAFPKAEGASGTVTIWALANTRLAAEVARTPLSATSGGQPVPLVVHTRIGTLAVQGFAVTTAAEAPLRRLVARLRNAFG